MSVERGHAGATTKPFDAMTSGPFAQLLLVHKAGYRWDSEMAPSRIVPRRRQESGPWLTDGVAGGALFDARQYAPLAVPGLHRGFAQVPPNKEGFLRFANRYGFLGHGQMLVGPSRPSPLFRGEPWRFWLEERNRLRMLLRLWDWVKLEDGRRLERYVEWGPDGSLVRVIVGWDEEGPLEKSVRTTESLKRLPPGVGVDTRLLATRGGGDQQAELLRRWRPGDAIEPVRYFIHREVNHKMRGHVHPTVLPFSKGEILFFPDCLLGALYTHFAMELSGRARPAQVCVRPNCGIYFVPKRRNQQYCADACRKLAHYYRKRKPRAAAAPKRPVVAAEYAAT